MIFILPKGAIFVSSWFFDSCGKPLLGQILLVGGNVFFDQKATVSLMVVCCAGACLNFKGAEPPPTHILGHGC